jgi:hypothetical protein
MFSTRLLWRLLAALLLALLVMGRTPVWANPDVLYAAPTASGNSDCSAWAHACTLQTALTNAVSGDEIWVKAGVHYPGSNRADTFTLKNGVEVYGGFAGTETNRNQRNWQSNPTILSGDIDQNDNHGGDFINENTSQIVGSNAYHVLTGSGTNGTAVLDGFIITAGQANGSGWPADYGGGMLNVSGSPTLANLRFSGNFAQAAGGGMYNNGSSPTLTNVTFQGNSAGQYGGGMDNWNSSPSLTGVRFSSNSAGLDGGGMGNGQSSNPTLTRVTFIANSAGGNGGGMNNYLSNPTLTNVLFSGNSAGQNGGGMRNYDSSPILTNVTFQGNSADQNGGGISNWSNSSPTLRNGIVWGNTAPNRPEIHNDSSTPTISYSDIQGCGGSGSWDSACGNDGGNNIDANPLFVNTGNGNLRLNFGSPAIDTGTNTNCPTIDLDGLPRPTDGNADGTATCDMGAYEAGTMICSVAQGNTYTFGDQSNVSIYITTIGNLACLYVDELRVHHANATAGLKTGRYWIIRGLQSDKQTDATNFTVNVTLPTFFVPDNNDKVCRYTGTGQVWNCAMSAYTSNSITRNGVTVLASDWAAGNQVGPTAVSLRSLTARPTHGVPPGLPGALALLVLAGWAIRCRPRRNRPRYRSDSVQREWSEKSSS